MTSGMFLDPAGNRCRLVANTPRDFRVLVTRKLRAGWRLCEESPLLEPLDDTVELAVVPGPPTPPRPVVERPRPPVAPEWAPPDEQRAEAVAEALTFDVGDLEGE